MPDDDGFAHLPELTERQMRQRDRDESRPFRESYELGRRTERESRAGRSESRQRRQRVSTRVAPSQPQRVIVGTMAFGVVFAMIATEINVLRSEGTTRNKHNTNAVRILLGGGVATIILLVVSHAGDAGAELAEGIALVSMVTTLLVTGKPVWELTQTALGPGSKPTTPTVPAGTPNNPSLKGHQ